MMLNQTVQNLPQETLVLKKKNTKKILLIILLVVALLAVGFMKMIIDTNTNDIFEKDGFNIYSDKNVSITKISKEEYSQKQTDSFYEHYFTNEKVLIDPEKMETYDFSYLDINNNQYFTYPHNRNGNYKIFDYGVIMRQKDGAYTDDIYYLDLKTSTIKKMSDEIRAYQNSGINIFQNDNYTFVAYGDGAYRAGDGGGNKYLKVVLFSKNGNKKIIAKLANTQNNSPLVINGFMKENNFYFQIDFLRPEKAMSEDLVSMSDQYYVVKVLDDNFLNENIFHDFEDDIQNRNVTSLSYEEKMTLCETFDSPIECKVKTAISYDDEIFCKNLLDKGDGKSLMWANRCFEGVALKTENRDLCQKMLDLPKNDEMYNLSLKETCMVDASGQLLRFEPNYCSTLKHPYVREMCTVKTAILSLDENICSQIDLNSKYIGQNKCRDKVSLKRQFPSVDIDLGLE